jgi:hypothetical protein
MTVSAFLECSTCNHVLRIRYQVGYVHPFVVKIACDQCGKLLKGQIRQDGKTFSFPNDKVTHEWLETTQTVSVSTELPIAIKNTNVGGMTALSPFMAMSQLVPINKVMNSTSTIVAFMKSFDGLFSNLLTSNELFQSGNWKYFLAHTHRHFPLPPLNSEESFENSLDTFNRVLNEWYVYLSTDFYKIHFNQFLQNLTIDACSTKIAELKSLKASLDTYINLELECQKAFDLSMRFLENIKSFFPVIALSYNDDFTRVYGDDAGLTTFEFSDLKDLYIEQFEYLSRISSLHFGLLNLDQRGDFNNFGAINLPSMAAYYSKDNGVKKNYVAESPELNKYFLSTLNSQVRNGIGHLKTVYLPKEQIIRYYPFKEVAKVNTYKEIYLIDFAFQVYQQALKIKDSLDILTKFIALTKL